MASRIHPPISQRLPRVDSNTNESAARGETRFVIGVDFGTTYTGVSWILTTGRRLESTDEIYTVINWPGAGSAKELQRKVPSEYTYSAMGGKSWGYGISDSQYVIRWMKLQLRPPSRYDALQTLVQNLKDAPLLVRMDQRPDEQRPLPMHLIKAPVDVVTAYMSEVADSVLESIRAERDESTLEEYPIDLVITHPAEWPETAINLTMKAITEAFAVAFSGVKGGLGANFRQVFLATEPEACAQMTMNDAMKDKTSNLRAGDCFVIVDAGGGTVDVISCRVQSINPFCIVPVTKPASGRYGSTYVDNCFLDEFLPNRLDSMDYHNRMYDPDRHGHGPHRVLRPEEQRLLRYFLRIKHNFCGRPSPGEEGPDESIPLPRNVRANPDTGSSDGTLRVTCDDMEKMFKTSVDGTLRLIKEQIGKLTLMGGRFRTIFLSGGFSSNEYLFRRVQANAQGANVVRAKDSLTAVSKGAVLLGLGLDCDMPIPAERCPYHVGVVLSTRFSRFSHDESQIYMDSLEHPDDAERAKEHIHWVISKGDLINPAREDGEDAGIYKEIPIIRRITRDGSKAGSLSIVMSRKDSEREIPRTYPGPGIDRMETSAEELRYDIERAFDKFQATPQYKCRSTGKVDFARVHMRLGITARPGAVVFQLKISSQQEALGDAVWPGTWVLAELIMPLQSETEERVHGDGVIV